MMKNIVSAILLFLVAVAPAFAEEKRNPLDEFYGTSGFHLITCKLETNIALMKVQSGEITEAITTISACQKKARDEVKSLFPKANKFLAKKPGAQKALKDYYSAWMSAISGIMPGTEEQQSVYTKRQDDNSRNVNDMWNKVEIEAGL